MNSRSNRPSLVAELAIVAWVCISVVAPAPLKAAAVTAAEEAGDAQQLKITERSLAGRRFSFYWKSSDGGGLNGVATLKADGTIDGIGSPNESTWMVDGSGQLLFKHADGRVSTRYVKATETEGLTCFEGPFLFRDGIVHLLVEVDSLENEHPQSITAEQASAIQYSSQQFVYLDLDETYTIRLKNGVKKTIQLKSVEEHADQIIGLVRSARVDVEVDGQHLSLKCAPYVLPTEFNGLRIQADTTSAWVQIPKRVQLSVWDASDPIVDTNRFCFPLPHYRLFSLGIQAYNEPVHLGHGDGDPQGQRFHHNYGVDLAGYDGRQKVVSCIDGVVVQVASQEGTLSIQDDRGFILVYGHLDSVLSNVKIGAPVERGQWIGMLGKRGASGDFSHLHVGSYLSEAAMLTARMNRNLNLYPWLVAAYRATSDEALCAVARPHHTVRVGETVVLDGTNSPFHGSRVASYRWAFHDGTSAASPIAEKVYDKPGCYMAALWIEGDDESTDVDFCRVRVFSDPVAEPHIPTLFVTCTPAGSARVGQPVNFRIWPQGGRVSSIQLDFGDGAHLANYRPNSAITHIFTKPGLYVVTASAAAGDLPITQKIKILVQD